MAKLGFGKYKDLDIRDVPEDYLLWLISNSKQRIIEYQTELDRREKMDDANLSIMERLIKKGYRELAKEVHPDTGGTTSEMQELNSAYEAAMSKLKGMR